MKTDVIINRWVKFLNLPFRPYFGSLFDYDHIQDFYYLDDIIKQSFEFALHYFCDTSDYTNILIGGPKGSGKTSFINYLKYISENDESCPIYIIVIDLEDYSDKNIKNLLPYIKDCLIDHFKESKIPENKVANILNEVNSLNNSLDAIRYLLNQREHYLSRKEERDQFLLDNLIVIIDQVDFLDYDELVKVLKELFVYFNPGKKLHLIKAICARTETALSAKKHGANYFSTHFHRHISLEPPPIREILNKRFFLKNKRKFEINISDINEIFDVDIDHFITKLNNKNIRKMLEQVRCIFEGIEPYGTNFSSEGVKFTKRKLKENFFDILLNNNYIQNYYRKVKHWHKYPIYREVLEALSVYPILDKKFYTVLTKDFKFLGKEVTSTLYDLQEQDVIIQEYHMKDQSTPFFSLTSSGELYINMIFDQSYAKRCKAQQIWPQIPLWQKRYEDAEHFEKMARKYLKY